jgi:hypothetical protein
MIIYRYYVYDNDNAGAHHYHLLPPSIYRCHYQRPIKGVQTMFYHRLGPSRYFFNLLSCLLNLTNSFYFI